MMYECDLPEPDSNMLILICGPNEFNQSMNEILTEEGYKQNREFVIMWI